MFLWISSGSCPLDLLLVRSHQAELRSCDQSRRKNDALTLSATIPTQVQIMSTLMLFFRLRRKELLQHKLREQELVVSLRARTKTLDVELSSHVRIYALRSLNFLKNTSLFSKKMISSKLSCRQSKGLLGTNGVLLHVSSF